MDAFIIDTRDFCCRSLRLKYCLETMGYKMVHKARDAKIPGRYIWFYEVDDRMVEYLKEYFGRDVVWTWKR